jgi:hypothetical protein
MVNTAFYRENALARGELEAMYSQDWLARRVIDIIGKDATRNWISITAGQNKDKAEKIEKELRRLNVREKVNEAIRLGRLHGGALLIVGAFDGQETDMPLNKVRSVEFFDAVDRWQTFPQRYYTDENSMNYGMPETYLINRIQVRGTTTAIVHESRVIRFDGHYLPPIERMRNLGWHASVLENLKSELKSFGTSNQAASSIIQDFITKKVQIKNLRELLLNDKGEAQLMARLATLAYGMSIHNIAIFGDDEQFEKMGTPLTGLDKILTHFIDIVSAAAEIPKGRLFHNQSGILGGDAGGSDLRVHYDNIGAYQENDLRPKLKTIIDVVAEGIGVDSADVEFEFNPLWMLSELEESTVRKNIADSDAAYITAGVVEAEEVALSRFGGDGINLDEMTIDTDRREKYLEQLSKQEIDLDEGDVDDDVSSGEELEGEVNVKNNEEKP